MENFFLATTSNPRALPFIANEKGEREKLGFRYDGNHLQLVRLRDGATWNTSTVTKFCATVDEKTGLRHIEVKTKNSSYSLEEYKSEKEYEKKLKKNELLQFCYGKIAKG